MTADPDLWLPSEQAYTPDRPADPALDPDLQAFLDLHGPPPPPPAPPRRFRPTETVPTGDLL